MLGGFVEGWWWVGVGFDDVVLVGLGDLGDLGKEGGSLHLWLSL